MLTSKPLKLAVIGGGLSGLVAARRLEKEQPSAQVTLFESQSRLGGVLHTEWDEAGIGYLIENSADMFSTQPDAAVQLCQELGREDELISTQPVQPRAYIAVPVTDQVSDGIVPVPDGFSLMLPSNLQSVLDSKLLDADSKARFLQEKDIPPRESDEDESLESFVVRRFGKSVFDRLIQPLVSGIYTADPKKLSMRATMSRFLDLERKYGSLIAATQAMAQPSINEHQVSKLAFADQTASGARYDLFRAPRAGMGAMIEWLTQDLAQTEIRLNTEISAICPIANGWQIQSTGPSSNHQQSNAQATSLQQFDGVVLTGNAQMTARLLNPERSPSCDDPTAAEKTAADDVPFPVRSALRSALRSLVDSLQKIERASCAVVVIGLKKSQIRRPFAGYGIVVPEFLNRNLIAVSFSSNKFAERSPPDRVLMRCFIGGALHPDRVDWPDQKMLEVALKELGQWLQVEGDPELAKVYRWPSAMPQYHLGHLQIVQSIQDSVAQLPGLEVAGNSYKGVGIPVCIEQAESAAKNLLKWLSDRRMGVHRLQQI